MSLAVGCERLGRVIETKASVRARRFDNDTVILTQERVKNQTKLCLELCVVRPRITVETPVILGYHVSIEKLTLDKIKINTIFFFFWRADVYLSLI